MLRKAWAHISSIGIKNEYDDVLVKRITLTNQFSVVAMLVFLFSGMINYSLGDKFSAALIECLVITCFIGFYLNKIHLHRIAISMVYSLISLAAFYFDSYSGFLSGTYLYYFPLILSIAFTFDIKKDRKIMFIHFFVIILSISINMITDRELFKSDFLTDDKRAQMFMFNLLFSASAVGFFIYIMIQNNLKENHLYSVRIEERKQSEKTIQEALTEKNVLIAELHHRVKNNLAIISGLFSLKLNDDLHEDAKNVLLESRNRVRSMALIHNRLYNSDNLTDVNFEDYARELITEINSSYPAIANSVVINTNINNVSINVNSAIPCGLILNELLTNCFKHAFTGKSEGQIDVSFVKENEEYKLSVKDNGSGLPLHYNKKQSLGVTVIEALSEQLDGSYSYLSHDGTCFELKFRCS
ncbi:MAG: sensor histidine kinase [Bacteroidota bacterium]